MAKNIPARERPGGRTHGKYAAHGKVAFHYTWAKDKGRRVPAGVRGELKAARVQAYGHGYKGERDDG